MYVWKRHRSGGVAGIRRERTRRAAVLLFRHACARKRPRREVDVSSAGTKLKSTPHIPHKLPARRFRHPTPPRTHVCAGLLSEPPPPAPHRNAVAVLDGESSVGEGPRGT